MTRWFGLLVAGTIGTVALAACVPSGPPSQPTRQDLLVWGHSNALGTGQALQREGTWNVINGAVDGCALVHGVFLASGLEAGCPAGEDWRAPLQELINRHDPDLMVIGVGGADVFDRDWTAFASPEFDAEYLDGIADLLALLAGREVIWLAEPYLDPEDPALYEMGEAWRTDHINELNPSSGLTLVSLADLSPDAGDGIHFSPTGYDEIARRVLEVVAGS